MATTKGKRWNGNTDTLPATYLKEVMAKMMDYGDRVQFSLTSGGPEPSYQVINGADKKMTFDRQHHLLQAQTDDFAGANATRILTLEQVKALIAGIGIGSQGGARTTRVMRTAGSGRTAQVKLHDQFAAQRYEYFKNNRQALPPTIAEHSDEIADLMKIGKSAEEAFGEVVKKYF